MFGLVVVLEHALEPGLNPAKHMISEYSNSGSGQVMVVGFVVWAVSLAATAGLARTPAQARGVVRHVVTVSLGIAAAGAVLTAAFHTQTSAGVLPPGTTRTVDGRVHDLGSGVVALGLFAAAVGSLRLPEQRGVDRHWTLGLVLLAVAINAALLVVGPSVGGLRQRFLLLVGCVWQAMFIVSATGRRAGRPRPAPACGASPPPSRGNGSRTS